MKKWTKRAGLLFMAAASVYYGQAIMAAPAKPASPANGTSPATEVKLLDDAAANPAAPVATSPATPAGDAKAADAKTGDAKTGEGEAATDDAKGTEGRSVSKSEVNVSDEGTVEIHVNDASLVEVLRMLSLQSQKNIICSKEVRGTVTANLYNVTIREALDQVLHMNGYAYREKGNFINVYTVKEMQALEEAERKTNTEVFRLYYTPAVNAMNMIRPVLSQAAQVSATTPAVQGIPAGGTDVGGGSHAVEDMIIVTDFPDNLDKVRRILKEVDRRPQQVLVEATILRATLSEDNALGVDFNILAGVNFTDIVTQNGQFTNAIIDPAKNPKISSNAGSLGTGNAFSSPVNGGLKLGFVSDNVSVFLAALEGVTDTTVLANPKVLAVNKQKGEVIVGRKDGYKTTTQTQTSTIETVEFLDTGTKLIFRPFVGDDGYIRMELHPEDSNGGLTSAQLPFKVTTEMTSNIMVKDGHTIVIGGLFRESSDVARSQIPFLGNLPLAGPLFRNQRDRSTREEIIILLTPHIIKDDVVVDRLSKEEMKKAEQLRVGTRKGMMPWGRERMAEGEYEKALAEYNSSHRNNHKVLWHLNSAINLNPKFSEAIELKQRVTGKEVTGVDNSSVRGFVTRMILNDKVPSAAPAPTRTEGETKPATPSNQQAAKPEGYNPAGAEPTTKDPFAGTDPTEEVPLDEVMPEALPQGKPETTPETTPEVTPEATPTPTPTPTDSDADQAIKSDKSQAQSDPGSRVKWPAPDNGANKSEAKADAKAEGSEAKSESEPAVTEIPVEEIKPEAPAADQNK
jgi:type IV pilus assembly protein PilQ